MDAGYGTSDILVEGMSHQLIVDPKIWLSPGFMIGGKFGANYSTDKILAFEEQVYLRWNFLRMGRPDKPVNIFLQGGIGMLAMYRGKDTPLGDVKDNRGSLMFDMAAGITIPLGSRWHIEPLVRGGYPHIMGVSITVGYKFPFLQKTKRGKIAASDEVIRRILIAGIDSIMFGPDTEKYNADIDQNTQNRNETMLNSIASTLKKNPNFRVRIEGHANPVTYTPDEADKLITLSKMRANTIAERLKAMGVTEEQMFVTGVGGTKIISYDFRNMNRRVELIVIQVNTDL
ncbi:MAG: OmpA family protein [Treponema sp.]|nr:OmpA family protein [Treponema sp.]